MDAPGVDRDSVSLIKYLDSLPQTNKRKGVGVQGYCMGGPLAFRTAAAVRTGSARWAASMAAAWCLDQSTARTCWSPR